ncbi:MAG: hypothetical protein JNL24_10145 [Bacteroidia bacterium]|nr:hypothetical protein [Bacteroidia bacterium]
MTRLTSYTFLVLLLLLGHQTIGQTITHSKDSSCLTVKIFEVVGMTDLMDCNLIIANSHDTLIIKTGNIQNLYFKLDSGVSYTATVSKTGYETIITSWTYPDTSAYVEIEFFIPKVNLTKDEKKMAHVNTSRLKEWNEENRGGFQKITPNKNDFFTARIRTKSSGVETRYASYDETFETHAIVLYTMSPYFGPSECEKKAQAHFGFTCSASSHMNDREFRRKNKKAEKILLKRNGKNWKEEYNKMVIDC